MATTERPPDLPGLSQTPSRLPDVAQADGEAFGEVRIDHDTALAPDAPPEKFIDGVAGVRKAQVQHNGLRSKMEAGVREATGPARKAEAQAGVEGDRVQRPKLESRSDSAAVQAKQQDQRVEAAVKELGALPAHQRGFVSKGLVLFVEAAVVGFDVFVIHSALGQSGMGSTSVWGTSLTVPLGIAACNIAFGTLAGVIGTRVRSPLKLAGAVLAAGLLALLVSIVLLGLFRSNAIDAQNLALEKFARDEKPTGAFLLDPLWMMPLSLAGSVAAMIVMALWTAAKPGRDQQAIVAECRADRQKAFQVELSATERLDALDQRIADGQLDEHRIEADVQAAGVERELVDAVVRAGLDAEDSLAVAMKARYETSFLHHEKLHANGNVWRAIRLVRSPWRAAGAGLESTSPSGDSHSPASGSVPHDGRARRFSRR